jgi:hypothetical protein
MLDLLFPEKLFGRRLSLGAQRKLRLLNARAEEAIVRAHVKNALMIVESMSEDLPFDRAIDTYVRSLAIAEPTASAVVTRTLVAVGDELLPRRNAGRADDVLGDDMRPRLQLSEASEALQRSIKTA